MTYDLRGSWVRLQGIAEGSTKGADKYLEERGGKGLLSVGA